MKATWMHIYLLFCHQLQNLRMSLNEQYYIKCFRNVAMKIIALARTLVSLTDVFILVLDLTINEFWITSRWDTVGRHCFSFDKKEIRR